MSRVLAALCAVTLIAAAPASLPRTPDGHPDLQGYWDNSTLTPLERPPERGARLQERETQK